VCPRYDHAQEDAILVSSFEKPKENTLTEDKTNWYLYMVRCGDDSIYTGISINVEARIDKHNSGRGAKYTSTRLPVRLIFVEDQIDQSSAMKREIEVKRWGRKRKENLAKGFLPLKPRSKRVIKPAAKRVASKSP